ncbi:hypothetical protein EYF80_062799 [Liparis tanakae]|uniref:Uncharacterized protein n=1 Tax=Liparis tanakae TaxID=230148 RepID=A0A4Z2EDT9_9TELE|nr:hypothetical protein EYF80_062799 [Liparis tanakae]
MWTGSRTGPLLQNRLPVKKEHREKKKRGTSIPAFRGNVAKTSGCMRLAGETARSTTSRRSAFKRSSNLLFSQRQRGDRVEHDAGLAGRARVRVLGLLPDGLQQPAVVGGGGDGLGADVLHRAEGLGAQAQVVEPLLEQRVGLARPLGV